MNRKTTGGLKAAEELRLECLKDVIEIMQSRFGYPSFRSGQEDVVAAILERRDVLAILPTGRGKSLCFQLPALMIPGTAIVVTPLISLMRDQVKQATARGLPAACVFSDMTIQEVNQIYYEMIAGKYRLLYVSPERFIQPGFSALLRKVRVSFVAIDEAHCIDIWGADFRKSYLSLGSVIQHLECPIVAVTASATKITSEIIKASLIMDNPVVVKGSFNRENLFYSVFPRVRTDYWKQIVAKVDALQGSGIVYRTTRNDVETTADSLRARGISARAYHAGMELNARQGTQDAFMDGRCRVIVATIAFGMGIDKPDIRWILHADLSKNVEGYYQETGRAGRDGKDAVCAILYSPQSIPLLRAMADRVEKAVERDRAVDNLAAMVSYCVEAGCRRKKLLSYFGEHLEKPCGFCDNCKRDGVLND